jgi:ribosomal protein L29
VTRLRFRSSWPFFLQELHQLWFVLLKEKNQLYSERAGRTYKRGWSGVGRVRKVKESMARVKTVLKERAVVYQDTKSRLEARQAQWFHEQKQGGVASATKQ